jgi:hypothetical protein
MTFRDFEYFDFDLPPGGINEADWLAQQPPHIVYAPNHWATAVEQHEPRMVPNHTGIWGVDYLALMSRPAREPLAETGRLANREMWQSWVTEAFRLGYYRGERRNVPGFIDTDMVARDYLLLTVPVRPTLPDAPTADDMIWASPRMLSQREMWAMAGRPGGHPEMIVGQGFPPCRDKSAAGTRPLPPALVERIRAGLRRHEEAMREQLKGRLHRGGVPADAQVFTVDVTTAQRDFTADLLARHDRLMAQLMPGTGNAITPPGADDEPHVEPMAAKWIGSALADALREQDPLDD